MWSTLGARVARFPTAGLDQLLLHREREQAHTVSLADKEMWVASLLFLFT